jgi:hypothetical protein
VVTGCSDQKIRRHAAEAIEACRPIGVHFSSYSLFGSFRWRFFSTISRLAREVERLADAFRTKAVLLKPCTRAHRLMRFTPATLAVTRPSEAALDQRSIVAIRVFCRDIGGRLESIRLAHRLMMLMTWWLAIAGEKGCQSFEIVNVPETQKILIEFQ